MRPEKIRVAVLFGGRSCEHEVSVVSARSLVEAMPRGRYELFLVGITPQGQWFTDRDPASMLAADTLAPEAHLPVRLDLAGGRGLVVGDKAAAVIDQAVDVVFPLLHGPHGEDGTIQGLLELADLAYVGSGVVGSAVGMDKELSRRAFTAENLPQVSYRVVRRRRWEQARERILSDLETALGYPLFIKPVSLGSSVGISRATNGGELAAAVDMAAQYDYKVMVEAEAGDCREIEVGLLGNEEPQASLPGEIITEHTFYDYQAKYVDTSSRLVIPADLDAETDRRIRRLAVRAFRAVEAAGLSRVDFFVGRSGGDIYVNEINTMPGFTPQSMYPKLWDASGISYAELIDRLIELALERHRDKRRTRTVR